MHGRRIEPVPDGGCRAIFGNGAGAVQKLVDRIETHWAAARAAVRRRPQSDSWIGPIGRGRIYAGHRRSAAYNRIGGGSGFNGFSVAEASDSYSAAIWRKSAAVSLFDIVWAKRRHFAASLRQSAALRLWSMRDFTPLATCSPRLTGPVMIGSAPRGRTGATRRRIIRAGWACRTLLKGNRPRAPVRTCRVLQPAGAATRSRIEIQMP